jgi:putative iron-dependent peroxidase
MTTPQTGIFALGTHAHSYLELYLNEGADPRATLAIAAGLSEPRTTMGGVNLVLGFRPELWASVMPDHSPAGLAGFNAPVVGPDGFTMPATQHDIFLWTAGGSRDVVFDTATAIIDAFAGHATVADEVSGWTYHRDRDLTGFIDGTENPHLSEAPRRVLVRRGTPGAGGSVLLVQKWRHEADKWNALTVPEQELAMGRTKPDSVELDDRPDTSHVARTDQDDFGKIFRRNTPFGSARQHGTMFVGFCDRQGPLAGMIASMAGLSGGVRDALTLYTTPLTGAYYFIPSLDDLAVLAPPEEGD